MIELKYGRIGIWQNWNVVELEYRRIGILNWNIVELEYCRIGISILMNLLLPHLLLYLLTFKCYDNLMRAIISFPFYFELFFGVSIFQKLLLAFLSLLLLQGFNLLFLHPSRVRTCFYSKPDPWQHHCPQSSRIRRHRASPSFCTFSHLLAY